jgi:hypothetical protein
VFKIQRETGRATVLDDCDEGKASSALATAFEILNEEAGKNEGGRKIIVLGKIENSEKGRITELLAAAGIDMIFGYGDNFQEFLDQPSKGVAANIYTDAESLADAVYEYIGGRDCVLIRGPRENNGLSKVLAALIRDAGGDGVPEDVEFLMPKPWYDEEVVEEVYEKEMTEEIRLPAYSAYSLDRMVMLQSGGVDLEVEEGLGRALFLNLMLQLFCEKKISLADEIVMQNRAREDGDQRDSIGLEFEDRVSVGLLLEALIVSKAPDVILALGDFYNRAFKFPVRQSLNEMARRLKLSANVFKNITGRRDQKTKQCFYPEDLFKIAVEIFSLPADGLKLLKTVFAVYKGKCFETDSVLHGVDGILYYYCFGYSSHHAIALAKIGEEHVCVCVCGARTPYERDAAICRTLLSSQKKMSAAVEHVWRPVGENQDRRTVAIAGNTYFGSGNAPLPEETGALLSEDDFNIVNFEAALTRFKTSPYERYLGHVLRDNPKRAAAELKARHVHGVMLANEHSMDYGGAACRQTLRTLRAEQILTVGSGLNVNEAERPLFLIVGGRRILFFNVCAFEETRHYLCRQYAMGANPGAACLSDSYHAMLRDYRSQYPEAFIIVSPHWKKGFLQRMEETRRLAARLIADGADCVLGHGAHEISGFEIIHGGFVLYSLGDFIFNHSSGDQPCGYVTRLRFYDDFAEVGVYPVTVRGEDGRLRPHPATLEEFQQVAHTFHIPSGLGKMDEKGYYFAMQVSRVKYHADSTES